MCTPRSESANLVLFPARMHVILFLSLLFLVEEYQKKNLIQIRLIFSNVSQPFYVAAEYVLRILRLLTVGFLPSTVHPAAHPTVPAAVAFQALSQRVQRRMIGSMIIYLSGIYGYKTHRSTKD